MASPISFTIELRRCWTTERVMGSILADIDALLLETSRYNRSMAGGKPSRSRGATHPSFAQTFSPEEGAGNAGVRAAPAVSCARCTKKTHTSIQVQRKYSGIPHAMA